MDEEIMVAIQCITYNHRPYIQQCLDGFIMQQTNFRFVAIVHDDASTDGTTDVVREYAQKYPDIIYPIIQKENQYSKDLNIIRIALDREMKGKYIASCEGDDYWTDPFKLQKQVDFLESHPDYSMCFHQASRHFQNSSKPDEPYSIIEDKDYTGLEMFDRRHRPPTASIVMKKSVIDSSVYKDFIKHNLSFGDLPIFFSCAHCGKVRGMTDIMSVYRMHEGGITQVLKHDDKKYLKFANDNLTLYKIFGNQYKEECIKIYVKDYVNLFFAHRKEGKWDLQLILKPLFRFPKHTIQYLSHRFHTHTL